MPQYAEASLNLDRNWLATQLFTNQLGYTGVGSCSWERSATRKCSSSTHVVAKSKVLVTKLNESFLVCGAYELPCLVMFLIPLSQCFWVYQIMSASLIGVVMNSSWIEIKRWRNLIYLRYHYLKVKKVTLQSSVSLA